MDRSRSGLRVLALSTVRQSLDGEHRWTDDCKVHMRPEERLMQSQYQRITAVDQPHLPGVGVGILTAGDRGCVRDPNAPTISP